MVLGLVGLVFGLVSVRTLASPPPAKAYVGETIVESGAALSKEAESVLKNGKFIPELFNGGGGDPPVPPGDGWGDWFGGGGFMPLRAIGAGALAFGVGTVIGSEICHSVLGMEGCWYFHSNGADPAEPGSLHWSFQTSKTEATQGAEVIKIPAFNWVLSSSKTGGPLSIIIAGNKECEATPRSGSTSTMTFSKTAACGAKSEPVTSGVALRNPFTNRGVGFNALDDPGTTNNTEANFCPRVGPGTTTGCTTEPPANWAERLRTCLDEPEKCSLTAEQRDKIGQKIASATPTGEKEGIHDPYATYKTVPTCTSTYTPCKEELEKRELVPIREKLGWEFAHLDKPADAVIEISPGSGTEVKVGAHITVVTNPGTDGMPLTIPEPGVNETYSEYITKLSPGLDPTKV
jgi:hypothetical protein